MQPDPYLVSLIRFRHPEVELSFDTVDQKWMLTRQGPDGLPRFLTRIEGVPTVENTVGWLTEHDTIELHNQWQRDAFLQRLNEEREAAEAERETRILEPVLNGEPIWALRKAFKKLRGA